MVTIIFQLLLLVSVITIGTNINMDMFDLIFFRTGVIILFMASLLDKPKREIPDYLNRITVGLLGLCVFNIFIHNFAPIVLATTMNIFIAVMGFYIVYRYWDEEKGLVKFILIAGAINLIFYFCQKIGFDPVFNNTIDKAYSDGGGAFLGNVARLSNYFALIIAFLPLPFAIASLVLVWLTKQFVILIPIVLILFFKMKSFRYRLLLSLGCVIFIAVAYKHIYYSLIETRFNTFWKVALIAFFDRPLLGYGLGVNIIKDQGAVFNSYLQFIVGVGILGAIWFGYTINQLRKVISINFYTIPLIVLGLVMLIEYPVEITRLWFLIIGIIVIALVKGKKERVLCH